MNTTDYEILVLQAFFQEDAKVSARIRTEVPAEFFLNAKFRDIYKIACDYSDQYDVLPTQTILQELLAKARPGEGDLFAVQVQKVFTYDESTDPAHLSYWLLQLDERWRSAEAQAKIGKSFELFKVNDVENALRVLHEEVPNPRKIYLIGDVEKDLYKSAADIAERAKHPELYLGIPMGFPSIDTATLGHGRGELVLVVGGTGGGKTLVLGQTAINVAKQKKKVLFVTVENNRRAVLSRIYSNIARIPYSKFKANALDQVDLDTWYGAMGNLPDNFFLKVVEFPMGCSPRDIWEFARTLDVELDYLVVDQVNNMTPNDPDKFKELSYQWYGRIAWELKCLGGYAYKNKGIPVLAAAQASGGTAGKKEFTVDDIAAAKAMIHHSHGSLFIARDGDEFGMGASKYRDASIKTFPVFPEFKYWSITEQANLYGFSGSTTIPQDRPQAVPGLGAANAPGPIVTVIDDPDGGM